MTLVHARSLAVVSLSFGVGEATARRVLSRSPLFKILEVREASHRKSLQGLDNAAADGLAAFQHFRLLR